MAVQYDPIAKDESLNTTELSPRNVADVLAQELAGIALAISSGSPIASYVLRCPTSGYSLESVSVWGVTKSLYKIIIYADSGSNPLTNFHSGMKEDYPINVDGSQADFGKLYAHSIGEGQVTFYFTSAPTTAFNVLIREAV